MFEIVDTHQHLWDLARHSYSWCAAIPLLNRTFAMADYLDASRGLDVVQSVHVEADVDEKDMAAETNWLLGLARDPATPLAALVIKALPEREAFATYLDPFSGVKEIKGVRRVLHTEDDALSTTPVFRENVRSLARRGLSFDLCVLGRQLPVGIELVRACPDVSFVLDHAGVPDIKGNAFEAWSASIRTLAALPNVVGCKLSGLVAYADPSRDLSTQLKPYVDHAIECFSPGRLMFGSDWPVCLLATSFEGWVSLARELTASLTANEQAAIFAGNARRIYRL